MLQSLFNSMFGCSHRRTTFPMSPQRRNGVQHNTYVTCLDCGKELNYDWAEMRMGDPIPATAPAAHVQPSYR